MTCRDYRDLMMAFLDDELDEPQKKTFLDHCAVCRGCSEELGAFMKLKGITDQVALAEPEDRIWEQYWQSVYNRIERGLGWTLSSLALIGLVVYGGFCALERVIRHPDVCLFLKVALLALVVGLGILFVSVARERLFIWKKERYKEVRR